MSDVHLHAADRHDGQPPPGCARCSIGQESLIVTLRGRTPPRASRVGWGSVRPGFSPFHARSRHGPRPAAGPVLHGRRRTSELRPGRGGVAPRPALSTTNPGRSSCPPPTASPAGRRSARATSPTNPLSPAPAWPRSGAARRLTRPLPVDGLREVGRAAPTAGGAGRRRDRPDLPRTTRPPCVPARRRTPGRPPGPRRTTGRGAGSGCPPRWRPRSPRRRCRHR